MNTLLRWGKFNIVGAIGMGVQLTTLAFFDRWSGGHYLLASAVAIEITLLHNFIWHFHYTWRDRCETENWIGPCLRFHLSNGMVSMFGNLALMRLLVHEAHLPILAANVAAILCCSIVNFWIGNHWAFAQANHQTQPKNMKTPRVVHSIALLALCAMQTRRL